MIFSTLNFLENAVKLSRLLETKIERIVPIRFEILADPIFYLLQMSYVNETSE